MTGDHKIFPRWGQPLTGIIATIILTSISLATWYVFSDPRGPVHSYEHPFLVILAWMVLVGIWQHIVFGDWPFHKLSPGKRLAVELIVNLVVTWFIIFVVFDKILGKVVFPFWSAAKMSQLTGAPIEKMWENPVGGALTLLVLTGFFCYTFWTIAFQKWLFGGKLEQPALGIAEWTLTTIVTLVVYSLTFVPFFMFALKDPMGGNIWWEGFAGTKHVNYIVSILQWMAIYILMTANIWEGKPWCLVPKQPWRGIVTVIGIFLMAFVTMKVLMAGMNYLYGPADPKLPDGIKSLSYRYYHVASISGFTLFPLLIWNHFFDNWPKQFGSVAGWIIRTVGCFVVGGILMFIYYKISLPVLGLKPILSNLENKPLVWLFWWAIPVIFSEWFGHKWPFYTEENLSHDVKQKISA